MPYNNGTGYPGQPNPNSPPNKNKPYPPHPTHVKQTIGTANPTKRSNSGSGFFSFVNNHFFKPIEQAGSEGENYFNKNIVQPGERALNTARTYTMKHIVQPGERLINRGKNWVSGEAHATVAGGRRLVHTVGNDLYHMTHHGSGGSKHNGSGHSKSKVTSGTRTGKTGNKASYNPTGPTPSAGRPSSTGDYYAQQAYNYSSQNQPPPPSGKAVPFPGVPDPYAGYPVAKPNTMERWNDVADDIFNLPYNALQKGSNYFGDLLDQNRQYEIQHGATPASWALKVPYGLAKTVTGILPGLHELTDDLPKETFLANMTGTASDLLFPFVIGNDIYRGSHHGKSPAFLNAIAQTGANEHRAAQDHLKWRRPAGYDPSLFGHHQSSVLQDYADVGNNYLNLIRPDQWMEDPVGNLITMADLDDPLVRISGKIEHMAGKGAEGASKAGHPTVAAGYKRVKSGAGKVKETAEKVSQVKEGATKKVGEAIFGTPPPDRYIVHQVGKSSAFKVIDTTTGKWIRNPDSRGGYYGSADAANKRIQTLAPPKKERHVEFPDVDTSSPPADKKHPKGRPKNGMQNLNSHSPAVQDHMRRHFNRLGHKYSAAGHASYR